MIQALQLSKTCSNNSSLDVVPALAVAVLNRMKSLSSPLESTGMGRELDNRLGRRAMAGQVVQVLYRGDVMRNPVIEHRAKRSDDGRGPKK
jgi:hypothetical protein